MNPSTSSIFGFAARLRRAMLEEYRILQEAEYRAAEEETGGQLVNRRGQESGWGSWSVFTGAPTVVSAYGTEELHRYLERKPRTTRTDFEKTWLENYLGGSDDDYDTDPPRDHEW